MLSDAKSCKRPPNNSEEKEPKPLTFTLSPVKLHLYMKAHESKYVKMPGELSRKCGIFNSPCVLCWHNCVARFNTLVAGTHVRKKIKGYLYVIIRDIRNNSKWMTTRRQSFDLRGWRWSRKEIADRLVNTGAGPFINKSRRLHWDNKMRTFLRVKYP